MKNILLLGIFVFIIFCQNCQPKDTYDLRVRSTTFKRSSKLLLSQTAIQTCLEKYNYMNSYKTFYVAPNGLIISSMEPIINNQKHFINLRLNYYLNTFDADQRFKRMMENGDIKCFDPYTVVGEAAFIRINKECLGSTIYMLYGNYYIIIDVTPFGKTQHPSHATDEYNRLKKEILFDFVNDFYPYFLQCAERAKVPVQE